MRKGLYIAMLIALTACAEFPQLNETVTAADRDAPYPSLIPVEDIKASIPEPRVTDTTAENVNARGQGLKARAARLQNAQIN